MLDQLSTTSRRAILGLIAVGVVILSTAGFFAFSAKSKVSLINIGADEVAIHGYDTVAYFTESKPMKGKSEFEHAWEGARWRFASATHRDLFSANPERYAPQYGGYCSLGVAIGEYGDSDPEQWAIVEGKLYLNKNKKVRQNWAKSPEANIFGADVNWRKYSDELRINENLQHMY